MGFKTDIEIAQETTMAPITEIAEKALDISCKTIQIFIGAAFILPDHGHQATSHSQQLLICTGSLGCFRRSSCLYDSNTDSLMDTPVLQKIIFSSTKGCCCIMVCLDWRCNYCSRDTRACGE